MDGWRLQEARRRCLAAETVIEAGIWIPGTESEAARGGYGLLILEGFLLRRVCAAPRCTAELLGPGDVVRPWRADGEGTALPFAVSFSVLERMRIAILDDAFVRRAAPFPEVAVSISRRSMERARTLALILAIMHYPHVRKRLLLLLWHLAERWGKVTPDGIRIPLRLRHHVLAEIIAVRRPSVTSAFGRLIAEGLVERTEDGILLHGDVIDAVDRAPVEQLVL